jgi:hypothetical protein
LTGERLASIVAITGMGRSGTSMVARILRECGLELGPVELMLPPNDSNVEGHWEHSGFVHLNDEVLAATGGAWNIPPEPEPDWAVDSRVMPFRPRARELAREFEGMDMWGWKDPRTALTLPFWQSVLGPLTVVVCIRDPREVARSLAARDGSPYGWALELWLEYYRRLTRAIGSGGWCVTHYDSFFLDPVSEIRRLAGSIGLQPSQAMVARAAASVKPTIRHHDAATEREGIPKAVDELYTALAGSIETSPQRRQEAL